MASGKSLLVRFGGDLSPLEKSIVSASKSLEKFGREVVGIGKSLSAAVTVPLIGLGTAAVAAYETLDDANDRIRLGTGATGAALEKLSASMRSVYRDVPVSAQMASTAIADLNTRLGLSGQPLETMATQMLNLARISGSEVGPMIQSVSRAFGSWGVATQDQGAVLDHLWNVSQQTGVGVQQLADQLSGGGSALRAFGVPVGEAAILLGAFEKAGITSEQMVSGLTKGAQSFARAGRDMSSGFSETMAQIQAAPSATAAAAVAVDVFGRSGLVMADAIRRGAFDVDALRTAIMSSGETINKAAADTDGLAEALTKLKNRMTDALEPLGAAIVRVFLNMMPAFEACIGSLRTLVTAFAGLPPSVQTGIVVFAALSAAAGPALIALGGLIIYAAKVTESLIALKATGGAAIAAISAAYSAGTAAIATAYAGMQARMAASGGAFAALTAGATGAGAALLAFCTSPVTLTVAALGLIAWKWEWLKENVVIAADALAMGLNRAWTQTKDDAASIWGVIGPAVSSSASAALQTAVSMKDSLFDLAYAIGSSFYASVTERLTAVQDFAVSVWDSMKAGLSEIYDWIAAKLNAVLASVSSAVARIRSLAAQAVSAIASLVGLEATASSASPSPAFSGGPAAGGSMSIPALASGGVVTRPTFALIGESGPEAVIPLSSSGGMGFSGSGGGQTIIVNVNVNGSVATQADLTERIRKSLIRSANRNYTTGIV